MENNNPLPAEKKYDPIGCQHKLPNGFSAWSFQSESTGSGPEMDHRVSIHVCQLCGEIRVAGRRWDGKSKHVDRFCEEFNIHHPDAIDALIKQANFYNEEAKWGRLDELKAENDQLKEDFKSRGSLINNWKHSHEGLEKEHAALKERAEKMVSALEQVLSLAPLWEYQPPIKPEHEDEAWALSEMKRKTDEALSSWKEGEQKEGGNG